MGNDLTVDLRANGVQRLNSDLDSIAGRFSKINDRVKTLQPRFQATGQIFNQFGNLATRLGSGPLASLVGQLESAAMAITSLNSAMSKSKLAVAGAGLAAFVGGVSAGNQIRQYIPFFNEPDKLASETELQKRAGEVSLRTSALTSPGAATRLSLASIDSEISRLKSQTAEILGINTGLRQKLTPATQELIFQLERQRQAILDQKSAEQETGMDRLGQDVVAMQGGLLKGSNFGGGKRAYSFYNPEEGAAKLAIEREFDDRLKAFKQYTDDRAAIDSFAVENEKARQKSLVDFEKQMLLTRLQIHHDASAAVGDILGNLAETAKAFGKEGFAAWKALSIAQAIVSTYTSAVGAFASVVSIPYVGPFLAPIAAGAAVAAGLANVAKIASTNPEGFMAGGYTGDGPRHEIAGQVHRGEFVINAPAVQRSGIANLEAINAGGSSSVNVASPTISNVVFFDQAAMRNFLKSRMFRDEVVNVVRVSKMECGIA